ncbi:hypothetical protein BDK51DRAFT_34076 [Blyttiomyces helicus]|uniref:Uncharacterized protein n=1 Tax=Blyttiomyces helicus TaxID=388810 RepID=A0A4P9WSG1_9FUNG|nr:hypothetical protein BDK51DRAFT_34076 [Blyttiomyces helicus]|eukprot:RKO93946.1 hypothetical protein BDK51DRAFT_34076 [Blyttiomyces helicus]
MVTANVRTRSVWMRPAALDIFQRLVQYLDTFVTCPQYSRNFSNLTGGDGYPITFRRSDSGEIVAATDLTLTKGSWKTWATLTATSGRSTATKGEVSALFDWHGNGAAWTHWDDDNQEGENNSTPPDEDDDEQEGGKEEGRTLRCLGRMVHSTGGVHLAHNADIELMLAIAANMALDIADHVYRQQDLINFRADAVRARVGGLVLISAGSRGKYLI